MKRLDLWKLSLLNVFASPVRSLLTVLGFAIGVAAILAVLTLGEAGKQQVQSEMGRLGIDRVWVTADDGYQLTRGTGTWLTDTIGAAAEELAYLPASVVSEEGRMVSAVVIGCDWSYLMGAKLKNGRMLWPLEWRRESHTVLAGEKLAEKLGIAAGDMISILQNSYLVAGIVSSGEGVTSVPLEDSLMMPIDALCRMTDGMIQEIQLTAPEGVSLQNTQKLALQALHLRGVSASAVTMQVQMEAASSVIFTFVNVLKWVALVCVLVGGIGVMNILLVSVRERKREIGVMKSMGTTPVQICTLFLLEALVYAVVGGILGIGMGMGLIDAAGRSIQLAAKASVTDCVWVFISALLTGIFFGVLPAFRASMLKCVDALRQE